MAISTIYDIHRDMYYRDEIERMHYMERERHRQMLDAQTRQMATAKAQQMYDDAPKVVPGVSNPAPATDPLAFLKKADNKLLLTGEAT